MNGAGMVMYPMFPQVHFIFFRLLFWLRIFICFFPKFLLKLNSSSPSEKSVVFPWLFTSLRP